MNLFRQKKRGFTIIEGLTALLVFSFLVVVFYKVFTQTTIHMQDGKQRRAAVSLANERMEHYRNLAYANVGTTTNAPFGNIVADENVSINDMGFRIISSVFLVDDPLDGRAANGTDLIPNDYKRVSVSIIWDKCVDTGTYPRAIAEYGSECQPKRVRLMSQFVPPGGLETVESGGILSINVLDEEAHGVPNATLIIYDSVRDESFAVQTDTSGNYLYIGAPACTDCYQVKVEKDEYEILGTKLSPAQKNVSATIGDVDYFPRFVHQSVTNGEMTMMSFVMQENADLTVTTEDPFGNEIADVGFSVYGGRVLGTNLNTNPLYTDPEVFGFYSGELTTNAEGKYEIQTDTTDNDIINSSDRTNPGVFTFSLSNTETNYVFWKMTSGLASNRQKVGVNPDVAIETKMILLDKEYKSVMIHAINSEGLPVSGAYVYLYDNNDTPVYNAMVQTDEYGYAYFPQRSETEPHDIVPLLEEDEEYEYVISAGGYESFTGTVTIEDDQLYEIEETLTAE